LGRKKLVGEEKEASRARKRETNHLLYERNSAACAEKRRRWRHDNPDRYGQYAKKYRMNNAEKVRAHLILFSAVKRGHVIKPDTCECGRPNPQGHHSDYSKPLMVSWLCPKCHSEIHRTGGTDGKR
jgi:hypothetical protein